MSRKGSLGSHRRADRNLALAFGTLVAVLMFSVLLIGRSMSSSFNEKNARETEASTVRLLSAAVERVSYSGKFHARLLLEDIVEENENLRYAILSDAEGLILAHSDSAKNGQQLSPEQLEVARAVLAGESAVFSDLSFDGEDVRQIASIYRGGFNSQEVGIVFLGLSQEQAKARESSAFTYVALIVAALTLLSVVAVTILSRLFGQGIRRMAGQLDGILGQAPLLIRIDDDSGAVARSRSYEEAGLDEDSLEEALAREGVDAQGEGRALWQSNEGQSYSLARFPIDISGKDSQSCLIGLDITEQERAKERLADSERRLRITLDSIADAVLTVDQEGRIERLNPSAQRLLGSEGEELRGQPMASLFRTRPLHGGDDELDWTVEHAEQERFLVLRDGTELRIECASRPMLDHAQETVGQVVIFRDITEKHRIETELWQAAKEESIGKLAGGIAHDFNNMLTGMLGATHLLERTLGKQPDSQSVRDSLELTGLISTSAERAGEMTRQLLAFSRKDQGEKEPVSVHELIRETVMLLERSIDKKIELVTELLASQDMVLADAATLQNAILNLGINARDAMADGGTLRLRSSSVHLTPEQRTSFDLADEVSDAIVVEVSDTGSGIPDELLPRIFEPYFTTKAVGLGTGLGLASVRGTVVSLGGVVRVKSRPGEGTTFSMVLPLYKGDQKGMVANPRAESKGEGRILLVDDEDIVRQTAAQSLEDYGFDVVCAFDGQEAIELFTESEQAFSAVVTDMVMPRMSGRELFLAIRKIDPKIPVIAVSGFTDEVDLDAMRELGLDDFVSKPYSQRELFDAVVAVLSAAESTG